MSKPSSRTTVYSLSKELSVSVATVSKALKGSPEISAQVRQRVMDLARERNFKPRVVSRKVPNICVLIQQYPGHPLDFGLFLSTVMEGVAGYVQEEGLEMSIYADSVEKLNASDIIRELGRRSIDGVVVLRSNDQSDYLQNLEREDFPYCALLSSSIDESRNTITVNNVEVGRRATEHLIGLGHRKIGILVSPPHGISGQARLQGYKLALAQAGVEFDPRLVLYENLEQNGLEFGQSAIETLRREHPDVTAVFLMDHAVAIGLFHGAWRMGVTIPKELSVISCDDYPESAYLCPPLTVVDIPNRELGYLAARRVYRLIRGLDPEPVGDRINLNGRLIERSSTCVPNC